MLFRKTLVILGATLLILSCANDSSPKKRVLSGSKGRLNTVKVVLENDLWNGQVGDSLRSVLAASCLGLPQEEPIFTIDQLNKESFKEFQKLSRLLVRVKKGDTTSVVYRNDVYATPQTGVFITGQTEEEIARLVSENATKMVAVLKSQELEERQNRIRKSLKPTDSLKRKLGINLRFPKMYRYAKEEDNFFWMRKDLKNGDMNVTVYEVPLFTIDRDTNTIARIIRMRDSIGGKNIPVDGGRFITQRDFAPYLQKTEIDGKPAWETKGIWEVDNLYMAGPFLNYAVKDEANDRYLILEGFIFAPSDDKRDNMLELEAILKSVKFL